MSQNAKKIVHLVYGIVLSLMILAVGICFVLSCLDIYHSGDHPFSPEAVSVHFQPIAVIVYVTLGLIALGFVLSLVLPLDKKRPKAIKEEQITLTKLKTKLRGTAAPKEATTRVIYRAVTAVLLIGLAVYPLLGFLNPSNFDKNLHEVTDAVITAVIPVFAWAAIAFFLLLLCTVLCRASFRREIEACKEALAEKREGSTENAKQSLSMRIKHAFEAHEKPILLALRCAVLAVAIVFIIIGAFFTEGLADVLSKAVAICTECIGLG